MGVFEIVTFKHRKHPDVEIKMPLRASARAGAYDMYSPCDVTVYPKTSEMIWTDIKAKFGDDEMLLLNVRSSMGKNHIMMANTQGWIDSDYYGNVGNDGNIGICLYNFGNVPYEVKAGDRIGQVMLVKHDIMISAEIEGERAGGFGSTGR